MTDTGLSALFPSCPMTAGGERLEVRPVILSELPQVERVLDGWRYLVASNGAVMDAEAWEAFLDLLASAACRTRPWLEALPESDFERLASLVLAINREIWDAEAPQRKGEEVQWPGIFQRLVAAGHPLEAIHRMTLAQARLFLVEAARLDRERLANDITAAAFSMADGKHVNKVLKELRRGEP